MLPQSLPVDIQYKKFILAYGFFYFNTYVMRLSRQGHELIVSDDIHYHLADKLDDACCWLPDTKCTEE